jgi:hypothetical protein
MINLSAGLYTTTIGWYFVVDFIYYFQNTFAKWGLLVTFEYICATGYLLNLIMRDIFLLMYATSDNACIWKLVHVGGRAQADGEEMEERRNMCPFPRYGEDRQEDAQQEEWLW